MDGTAGPLVVVTDPDDPRLDPYRRLADPAARRRMEAESGTFVAEGRVTVRQVLRNGLSVRSLLVDDRQVRHAADLVVAVQARGAAVYVAPPPVVAATAGFALHRGVVAVVDRPTERSVADVLAGAAGGSPAGDPMSPGAAAPGHEGHGGVPVVAVLEGLNDHENLGALFRNAAAFGVGGVLLDPRCADPWYRRSVRVSAGHVSTVPMARLSPWPAALDAVRRAGFVVAALAPHPPAGAGGGEPVPVAALPVVIAGRPVAVVLGAEGPGLSAEALAGADLVVTIPMADGVDSLNVATAAAVAFHRLTSG